MSRQALRQLTPEDTWWGHQGLRPGSGSGRLHRAAGCLLSSEPELPALTRAYQHQETSHPIVLLYPCINTYVHMHTCDHTHPARGRSRSTVVSTPNSSFLNITSSLACFPLNNCHPTLPHLLRAHVCLTHVPGSLLSRPAICEDQPKLVRLEWRPPIPWPPARPTRVCRGSLYTSGQAIACRTDSLV